MSASKTNVLKLIAGQAVIFVILMGLLDSALWLIAPVDNGLPPLAKHITQNIPGVKPEIIYERIENGPRALSLRNLARLPNSIRILCVGASTTEQTTQETADTWCGILEAKLQGDRRGRSLHVQTISYGRGGDKTLDTALWLREMVDSIDPDIVITLLGINDLAWSGGPERGDTQTLTQSNLGPPLTALRQATSFWRRCTEFSQLCRRIAKISRNILVQEQLRKGAAVEWHSDNLPRLRERLRRLPYVAEPNRRPDPIHEFRRNVDWIFNFLKQKHISVIVLGQPVLWGPNLTPDQINALWFALNTREGQIRASAPWLHSEMQRYNRVQRDAAEKHGFLYLDLDKYIPKTLDYYFDDCHFTDKGSVRVGEVVFSALRELLKSPTISKGDKSSPGQAVMKID